MRQSLLHFRCGSTALVASLLVVSAGVAHAQERTERAGVVLFRGLVPSAVVSQQHAVEELHGGRPAGGGKINHLVVALFDAKTARRIENAVVRAELSESGVVAAPAKYLPPMPVNGEASHGQLFGMVHDGAYRFRVTVKLPDRPDELQFDIQATPQLTGGR